MRSSHVIVSASLLGLAAVAAPATARAALGAGTEQYNNEGRRMGVQPGLEANAGLGTGFSSTYGISYEARLGYTFPVGVYVGGQVQAFYGQSVNSNRDHATFFGAEGGYKFFPLRYPIELRPYLFVGPAFITQVRSDGSVNSLTGFAVQPGGMVLYHLGPAYLGADFRFLAEPGPFAVSLYGMAGLGF